MKFTYAIFFSAGLIVLITGCSTTQEIADGAAGAADATGQATMQVIGTAGEGTAAVTRGAGEAATAATGGEGGMVKDVQGAADEIAKKRNVDIMGNDVVIDPSEDKKIRMEF